MTNGITFSEAKVFDGTCWVERPLSIRDGEIVEAESLNITLAGYRIAPGIIDLHGDGFERHVAPRRGVLKDLSHALFAVDAELAANGITTAYLAQFWSWEGGQRAPDFAKALAKSLHQARQYLRTDMRLQLRFETHLLDDFGAVLDFVDEVGIDFFVFNDHIPHAALEKGKRPPRLTGQALKSHRSPEAHLALLNELHANTDKVADARAELARELQARGCILGSHDDENAGDRDTYRAIGATIAEFPMGEGAVASAKDAGDPMIFGAPNVIRGGSHDGRLRVADHLEASHVLVSDYHYPAQKQAALIAEQDLGFENAWNLISANPAQVMRLSDRGSLKPGKRADLCILDRHSRVVGTMVAGRWSHLSGTLAEKLISH